MRLIVEGWRFIPHSFSLVAQYLLLEWLRRPDLELFHRDVPYFSRNWQPLAGLLEPAQEEALRSIPPPPPGLKVDATVRFFVPYNLQPDADARRTFVWGTVEYGVLQSQILEQMGLTSLADPQARTGVIFLTCSRWSRDGFVRSGADPERLRVVPLGVDPALFRPLPEEERRALRTLRQAEGTFVFLNLGVMTMTKGTAQLLRAFAAVAERHPQARLLLKGADALGPVRQVLEETAGKTLTSAEVARVQPRLAYFGQPFASRGIAALYQLADAYVSPYLAEGFNLPVLEAAACGLPVIVTQGGPTDDFTHPDFALPVRSTLTPALAGTQTRYLFVPDVSHLAQQMEAVILQPEIAARAREAGPRHVAGRYTWKQVAAELLDVLAADLAGAA
jgi:glycosyltransferase involved in cell wall biosynthesis